MLKRSGSFQSGPDWHSGPSPPNNFSSLIFVEHIVIIDRKNPEKQ